MTDDGTEYLKDIRSWLEGGLKWCPTSLHHLAAAESKVLKYVKGRLERFYVPISSGRRIWTLKVGSHKPDALPIVMVHGFGAAAGFFFLNFDSLAEHREVYAFDILGFGRSSRYEFSTKADVAEEEFVSSIEEWRSGVGLEKFVLMGTSFGGFLAASYAIKHPGRVTHLVLADPWGFPERTEQAAKELRKQMPFWMKIVCPLMSHFNLLAPSRVAGPLGPQLLRWARPDIRKKFANGFQDNTVIDYLYHCIAQPPSAETAFRHLQNGGWEWAKNPMLPRLSSLDPDVPITLIYGADTWMDSKTGEQAAILRKGSSVDTIYIKNAGHHMYAEQHGDFNRELVRICKHADEKDHLSVSTVKILSCD